MEKIATTNKIDKAAAILSGKTQYDVVAYCGCYFYKSDFINKIGNSMRKAKKLLETMPENYKKYGQEDFS